MHVENRLSVMQSFVLTVQPSAQILHGVIRVNSTIVCGGSRESQ